MFTKNHPPIKGDGLWDQCPSCGSFCDISKDLDDQDYCNDCRPETSTSKLTETLEQFRNGQERYDNDPVFKQAIDSLAAGVGVYAVLDSVLRRLSHQQEVVSNLTNQLKDNRNAV
jgi:hypothetical protein